LLKIFWWLILFSLHVSIGLSSIPLNCSLHHITVNLCHGMEIWNPLRHNHTSITM
jgi:hypothetical protein